MNRPRASATQQMLSTLSRLSAMPGGEFLVGKLIGWKIPYSGSIGARVVELKPGYAKTVLKDRRSIRNHLNSIHAIALSNLGELTSGLALNFGLPAGVRAIVTKITTEYFKKARGRLTAECRCELPAVSGDMEHVVEAQIRNTDQELVAKVSVVWRLGLV